MGGEEGVFVVPAGAEEEEVCGEGFGGREVDGVWGEVGDG